MVWSAISREKVIRKIIEAKGLEKTVQLNEHELTILKGINLDINYSESFAIVGPLDLEKLHS